MAASIAAVAPPGRTIRQLLPFVVVLFGALAFGRSDGQYPNAPFLFAMAVATFAFLPNNRAWVVAPLLVTELTLSDYIVKEMGLSLRLAVALAALALALGEVLRSGPLKDARFRRILLPALVFVAAATAVNSSHSESEFVFKYFRYQFAQFLFLLIPACTIRDRRGLFYVGAVGLAFGAASGFAGVWQHFDKHGAIFGNANAAIFSDWKGRSLGLSSNPVIMANNMLFVMGPMAGFIAAGVLPRGRLRVVMVGAFVLVFAGMYFTYTRSALLSLGAGIAGTALVLQGRRRTVVLFSVVGLYLLFQLGIAVGVVGGRYTQDKTNDRSAASHDALLEVGLAMAADHWLTGIGHEHFEEISAGYAALLDSEDFEVGGQEAVGQERPHNDFLSILIAYGAAGFLSYMALIVATLVNCAVAARRLDPLVRGMGVGCACGLLTYLANSAFHNSLDSSTALFLYAGLSVALVRMSDQLPTSRRTRAPRPWRLRRRSRASRAAAQYAFQG